MNDIDEDDISNEPPEDDFRRGRSVVSALHAHIVFVTKYRRGVLSDRALAVAKQSFIDVCHDFGVTLRECDGEDDQNNLGLSAREIKLLFGAANRIADAGRLGGGRF